MVDLLADSELATRLHALDEAREIASRYFSSSEIEHLDMVREKARSRLRHGTAHTVVAIAGATGSGKSSIVNRLAGAPISEASVRRPTTSATHAVVWGNDDAGPLLDWLEVNARHRVESAERRLDGLVLLDLPDHDSTAVEHRLEVDRMVALVDVLVWVTDPQKYADAALHVGYIQPLAQHSEILRFVLNQVDRLDDGGEQIATDFRRLLTDDGVDAPEVMAVSATTGSGFELLEEVLADAVEARTAALVRVGGDLADAATRLGRDGALDPPSRRAVTRLVEGLSEAAGSAVAADVATNHHRRQGSLAMGWPFTRFLRRLARKPLSDLPGPGRTGAAEPRADLALRDFAEETAGDATAPWPGALRAAVGAEHDALLDDLRRTVGRETVNVGRRPRWWNAVAWLQRVLAGAAVVGLAWLLTVAILGGFFHFDTEPLLPPTPGAEWMPVPSTLFLGGVATGLFVGLLVRIPLGIAAGRRGRSARRAIERQVEDHAMTRVVEPVRKIVADRAAIDALRQTAAN